MDMMDKDAIVVIRKNDRTLLLSLSPTNTMMMMIRIVCHV
jgi:hypothetical protein